MARRSWYSSAALPTGQSRAPLPLAPTHAARWRDVPVAPPVIAATPQAREEPAPEPPPLAKAISPPGEARPRQWRQYAAALPAAVRRMVCSLRGRPAFARGAVWATGLAIVAGSLGVSAWLVNRHGAASHSLTGEVALSQARELPAQVSRVSLKTVERLQVTSEAPATEENPLPAESSSPVTASPGAKSREEPAEMPEAGAPVAVWPDAEAATSPVPYGGARDTAPALPRAAALAQPEKFASPFDEKRAGPTCGPADCSLAGVCEFETCRYADSRLGTAIEWHDNYRASQQLARDEDKLMFVMCISGDFAVPEFT